MKKKIFIFITTFALLLSMAIPAFADSYGYQTSADDASSAVIAQGIYDAYGIEAFYVVDNSLGADDDVLEFANYSLGNLAQGDDAIIFAVTSTSYGIAATGRGEDYKQLVYASDIYAELEEYDIAGEDEMAAVTFLNYINLVIGNNYIGSNYNETAGSRLVDDADLLSDSEESTLLAKLDQISERQDFDVVVVTVDSLGGKSAMAYADDYFDYNGYGYGSNRDGCLLLISVDGGPGNRDWWISTRGYGITALTDAGIDYIGEQMLSDLKVEDYAAAFDTYAGTVDEFVTQAKNGEPYDVNNLPKSAGDIVKGVLICFVISLVIAFVVISVIKSNYKPVKFNRDAKNYFVDGSLMMTGSYDNYITSSVSQVRIESDSSSGGGGSSTHTSSSGATHGGGGGKF